MTIVQPKVKTPIRFQEIPAQELVDKTIELSVAARKTDDPEAPLIPDGKSGKGWCRWCKHKANCSALKNAEVQVISKGIPESDSNNELLQNVQEMMLDIESVSTDALARTLDIKDAMNAVFKRIEEELELRINNGETGFGYDMLPGRASNKWNVSGDEIAKILRNRKLKLDEIKPRKLISPAQMKKLEGLTKDQKEAIEKQYVSTITGAKKLTKVSRENKNLSVDDMFEDKNVAQRDNSVIQSGTKDEEVSFI